LLRRELGCSLPEAKAWVEGLEASGDEAEAATGRLIAGYRSVAAGLEAQSEAEAQEHLRAALALPLPTLLLDLSYASLSLRRSDGDVGRSRRLMMLEPRLAAFSSTSTEAARSGAALAPLVAHRY